MIRSYALEHRTPFLFEEWTEPYTRYSEKNTAGKNGVMCQDFPRCGRLRLTAGGKGA